MVIIIEDDEIMTFKDLKDKMLMEGVEVVVMQGVVFVKNTEGNWDRMRLKKHLIDHDFSPILLKSL